MKAMSAEERARRNAENGRKRRARLKFEKRCIYCAEQDEKTLAGYSLCIGCARFHSVYRKLQYQSHKANKRCPCCGKTDDRILKQGKVYCQECVDRHKEQESKNGRAKEV